MRRCRFEPECLWKRCGWRRHCLLVNEASFRVVIPRDADVHRVHHAWSAVGVNRLLLPRRHGDIQYPHAVILEEDTMVLGGGGDSVQAGWPWTRAWRSKCGRTARRAEAWGRDAPEEQANNKRSA